MFPHPPRKFVGILRPLTVVGGWGEKATGEGWGKTRSGRGEGVRGFRGFRGYFMLTRLAQQSADICTGLVPAFHINWLSWVGLNTTMTIQLRQA